MRGHHMAYARFYEMLNANTSMESFHEVFDVNATFEDPFQKVKGLENIKAVFDDMHESLHEPKFVIDEVISQEEIAYIRWNFYFALNKKSSQEHVVGVSRVLFDGHSGKVLQHIDYWDASMSIYAKIPILGAVLRYIKKRIAL